MRIGVRARFPSVRTIWIVVASCSFLAAGCATAESNPPEARGRELRAEIDRTYRKLDEARAIKNDGMGRNFITDVVTKYIPPGTSFADAEAILRSAGFAINARGANRFLQAPDKYDTRATIESYAWSFPARTSIHVSLRPRGPDDYSVVESLSAEITRSLP